MPFCDHVIIIYAIINIDKCFTYCCFYYIIKEEFKLKYENIINEALQSGNDMFILSDNTGKTLRQLTKQDLILGKIILTYKDKELGYKVIEYEKPFNIIGSIKIREKGTNNSIYYYLYIPSTQQFTLNSISNKNSFNSFADLKKYFKRYKRLNKEFRNYYLLNFK